MNIKEIRDLNDDQLHEKIAQAQKDLLKCRLRLANQQLKNNQEIRKNRTLIARLKTVLQGRNARG
jgi:ribosomal protein L29